MLKLIELQYQREIDRRKKQETKAQLEVEIGEKIIDSPLRRARDYANHLAGSPSPLKRIVTKGSFAFEISPEKSTIELRRKAEKPTFPAKSSATGTTTPSDNKKSPEKRVSAVAAAAATNQRSASKIHSRVATSATKIKPGQMIISATKQVRHLIQLKSTPKQ